MTRGIHDCFVAKDAQDLLRQSYPLLPEEMIKNARESSTFSWVGEGADTYTYDEILKKIMPFNENEGIVPDIRNYYRVEFFI